MYLRGTAISVLKTIKRQPSSGHVIYGTLPGKPLADLQPFWQRLRTRAGLKDVWIHDLRRKFASVVVASGQSLPTIGKLLGHSQVHDAQSLAANALSQSARDHRPDAHIRRWSV